MNAAELLQKIADSVRSTATVKSVFGDPIHLDGKTVVPVARVAYAFGAGYGSARAKGGTEPDAPADGGGGGGGHVHACPAGALEITPTSTRFIGAGDARWLAGAFLGGALLGRILAHRRSRS
jgi:uncharacterized spore protein YtfJ